MAESPHFELPFRWGHDGHAPCVEQDSEEDIEQCVFAIINTPTGFRLESPTFGVRPMVLEENAPSLPLLQAAIAEWEPRAHAVLTEKQFEDILSRLVNVGV